MRAILLARLVLPDSNAWRRIHTGTFGKGQGVAATVCASRAMNEAIKCRCYRRRVYRQLRYSPCVMRWPVAVIDDLSTGCPQCLTTYRYTKAIYPTRSCSNRFCRQGIGAIMNRRSIIVPESVENPLPIMKTTRSKAGQSKPQSMAAWISFSFKRRPIWKPSLSKTARSGSMAGRSDDRANAGGCERGSWVQFLRFGISMSRVPIRRHARAYCGAFIDQGRLRGGNRQREGWVFGPITIHRRNRRARLHPCQRSANALAWKR